MRFRVLGRLEVLGKDEAPIPIRSGNAARLLCLLLAHAPDMVGLEQICDVLWPDGPLPTGPKTVRVNVVLLRGVLDSPARIVTHRTPTGYSIDLREGELDAEVFRSWASRAEQLNRSGDDVARSEAFKLSGRALALWRGRPFPELEDHPSIAGVTHGLEMLRAKVLGNHIEAGLILGRHADLLPLLANVVQEYPGDEKFRGQFMVALHRNGRTSEALQLYEAFRATLAEELAVEPSTWLRDLSYAIARRDPALELGEDDGPAQRRTPKPAQLPPSAIGFTGRKKELDALLGGPKADASAVWVLHGMAGVGKTALACHAGQLLAERFPDGHLYLDLHAFTEGVPALEPIVALERLLGSFGVPAGALPDDVEERGAFWRSHIAGKRLLLLLDNARDEHQIQSLLPGSPGCMTLITSRRRLTGLENAQHVHLDVLPRSDAAELFRRIVGTDRVPDETTAALDAIVDYCGQLPLALWMVAARFATQESWHLADLAERLGNTGSRLGHLSISSYSVSAAFELSYLELDQPSRRMFRLLSHHVGPEFDRYDAAALAGIPVPEAEQALNTLAEAHLLQSETYGHYHFHDLLRAYATYLATRTNQEA